jgi:hypothetical protein
MKKVFQGFLQRIAILSVIIEVLSVVLYLLMPVKMYSHSTPFLVLFFFAVNTGFYYIILKLTNNKFSRFVNMFMILTFAKLFLYIIVILVYALLNKADAFPFVITFFILYIIYTIFEIISFLNDQKKMEKQS